MMKGAGNPQQTLMAFKKSTYCIQNNLASPDLKSFWNSVCGKGGYCHGDKYE
jgi:hypothetical protein